MLGSYERKFLAQKCAETARKQTKVAILSDKVPSNKLGRNNYN